MNLAERMKKLREVLEIGSQEALADIVNLKRSRIADIERGKVKQLKAEEALQFEEKLLINGWWLLTGKGDYLYKESNMPPVEYENVDVPDVTIDSYPIPALSVKASAGEGNDLEGIDSFDTDRKINIDKMLFNGRPQEKLRAIQVDGYSMAPMLMPDSWVIFERDRGYEGDGLYIINWRNVLMVKQIQLDMQNGRFQINSTNKDYESYRVDPDDQSVFKIIGKVIRAII